MLSVANKPIMLCVITLNVVIMSVVAHAKSLAYSSGNVSDYQLKLNNFDSSKARGSVAGNSGVNDTVVNQVPML